MNSMSNTYVHGKYERRYAALSGQRSLICLRTL